MNSYKYGKPEAEHVLVQMVDDHDLAVIENEVEAIRQNADKDFLLLAVPVRDWNQDLSPWRAPAVFGNNDFGDGAQNTLLEVTDLCQNKNKNYYIGGYSLAGLFALWAAYQTDLFKGVAAASPSIWFPGFIDYMRERQIRCHNVYLSLGDKEEKTRNPVMATVGEKIREAYVILEQQGNCCVLEWNQGNHFKDPDLRTAKAFSWLLNK